MKPFIDGPFVMNKHLFTVDLEFGPPLAQEVTNEELREKVRLAGGGTGVMSTIGLTFKMEFTRIIT